VGIDVHFSERGVLIADGTEAVSLGPEKAQSLAVDILARWPLERCERDTTDDWKADASRYLKDPSMLTRRFARRTLALAQAVEDALMQLAVAGLVKQAFRGVEDIRDGEG
jgi:hypothetical protein